MKKNTNLYLMVTYAIVTALLCIFAPMSVPIGPIPVSLTNLVLYFAICILGTKGTLASYIVYLLLGLVGLPVFSGFQGGPAKLIGPTGGYLVGFIITILIAGIFFEKSSQKIKIPMTFLGMLLGTAAVYFFGTAWFVIQMKCEIGYALGVCVFPFVPFDVAKMVIAIAVGMSVRKALVKAGLIAVA